MDDAAAAGTLRVDITPAALAEVRAFTRTRSRALGADEDAVVDLVQGVDEWVTNVLVHGYRGDPGPVEIEVDRDGASIVVHVRDEAPPFDPGTAAPFDPGQPLEARRLGGMGIYLMRETTDGMDHRAVPGGGNLLTLRRSAQSTQRGGIA